MAQFVLRKKLWATGLVLVLLGVIVDPTSAGILDYNMMSCMDFARHMGSTVPTRFGIIGGGDAAAVAKRQEVVSGLQNLVSSVTNVGNANVANCQAAERQGFCASIDGFLEQNFPQWFFDYKVTNNVNHVVGQVTTHRYHSLFEAGIKAYRCFCDC